MVRVHTTDNQRFARFTTHAARSRLSHVSRGRLFGLRSFSDDGDDYGVVIKLANEIDEHRLRDLIVPGNDRPVGTYVPHRGIRICVDLPQHRVAAEIALPPWQKR